MTILDKNNVKRPDYAKYNKSSKKFLSDLPEYDGNITWHVNASGPRVDSAVTIRDCYKQASLSFDMYGDYDKGYYKEHVRKIDNLISELRNFRSAFIKAEKPFIQNQKMEKKYREEKKANEND